MREEKMNSERERNKLVSGDLVRDIFFFNATITSF